MYTREIVTIYADISHEYLVYYIGYFLRGTTVSVATNTLTMHSIRGGTLGWNIEIYSIPMNQFDWSVSRAYVISIGYTIARSGLRTHNQRVSVYPRDTCERVGYNRRVTYVLL